MSKKFLQTAVLISIMMMTPFFSFANENGFQVDLEQLIIEVKELKRSGQVSDETADKLIAEITDSKEGKNPEEVESVRETASMCTARHLSRMPAGIAGSILHVESILDFCRPN